MHTGDMDAHHRVRIACQGQHLADLRDIADQFEESGQLETGLVPKLDHGLDPARDATLVDLNRVTLDDTGILEPGDPTLDRSHRESHLLRDRSQWTPRVLLQEAQDLVIDVVKGDRIVHA